MKLNINFMIKDGKRIISRDTKGYKIVLNRIVKEFTKSPLTQVLGFNVVIQMSKEASSNKHNIYSKIKGECRYTNQTIYIYWNNNNDLDDALETLAHEFGHVRQYFTRLSEYMRATSKAREKFADDYSRKILKRNVTPSVSYKLRSIAAMNRSK